MISMDRLFAFSYFACDEEGSRVVSTKNEIRSGKVFGDFVLKCWSFLFR